jgi:voltage-gated potassium channel
MSVAVYEFFMHELKRNVVKTIAYCILSPTLVFAKYKKSKVSHDPERVRLLLISFNWRYFCGTLLLVPLVCLLGRTSCAGAIMIPVFAYSLSRVNEIFIAFIEDASSHLRPRPRSSTLKYYERIPLAMRSYIELIILYGFIALSLEYWFDGLSRGTDAEDCIVTAWESIYFSGVTITTLGYGELTPRHWLSQFFSVYEVLNGFTLIVVSFTVYVSKSIDAKEADGANKP